MPVTNDSKNPILLKSSCKQCENLHAQKATENSFRHGFIAAISAKGITIPFDRLKILIQTRQPGFENTGFLRKNNNGILSAFAKMTRDAGAKSLFRSQAIALSRHGIHGGCGFLIRDNLQNTLNKNNTGMSRFFTHFLIGSASGVGATIITTPLDTIRVVHTTNVSYSYKDVWREMGSLKNPEVQNSFLNQSLLKYNNKLPNLVKIPETFIFRIQNLYAGHLYGQVGVVLYAGMNFGFKENFSDLFFQNHRTRKLFFKEDDFRKPKWYGSFISGWLAAAVTQGLTYPMEVVKRRKQSDNLRLF